MKVMRKMKVKINTMTDEDKVNKQLETELEVPAMVIDVASFWNFCLMSTRVFKNSLIESCKNLIER